MWSCRVYVVVPHSHHTYPVSKCSEQAPSVGFYLIGNLNITTLIVTIDHRSIMLWLTIMFCTNQRPLLYEIDARLWLVDSPLMVVIYPLLDNDNFGSNTHVQIITSSSLGIIMLQLQTDQRFNFFCFILLTLLFYNLFYYFLTTVMYYTTLFHLHLGKHLNCCRRLYFRQKLFEGLRKYFLRLVSDFITCT